ncbi:hypothetical protein Hanom_Chr07g00610061 [Helianthus anomalus]
MGKLQFSSFMFIPDCSGCPLTSIITVTVLFLLKTLHHRSFSTNLVNFKL